jgi:hypothetical protein
MIGAALRTDGANGTDDMPIAITDFDVDAAIGLVRGQKNRRILASAFPPINDIATMPSTVCCAIIYAHDTHLLPR